MGERKVKKKMKKMGVALFRSCGEFRIANAMYTELMLLSVTVLREIGISAP